MGKKFLLLKYFKIEILIMIPEHTFFQFLTTLGTLSDQAVPTPNNLEGYITVLIFIPKLKKATGTLVKFFHLSSGTKICCNHLVSLLNMS